MKTKNHIYVAIVLVMMLVAGAMMCMIWLPETLCYLFEFLPQGLRWLLRAFCVVIGMIFFGILLVATTFPKAIAQDRIFTAQTAKLVKALAVALFTDSLLLCMVCVWLLTAGERLLMPALLFVSFIGIMVSVAVKMLSHYLACAAELKEEADATL